jgi:hypothetical protein
MEGVFLDHLKRLYCKPESQRIKASRGQGGSPDCVINRMIKSELKIASYDRSLLLLDSDLPVEEKSMEKIKENGIELVLSDPSCLEGLMLKILGDLPKRGASTRSGALKKRFWKHVDAVNNNKAIRNLSRDANELFPRNVIEDARQTCPEL